MKRFFIMIGCSVFIFYAFFSAHVQAEGPTEAEVTAAVEILDRLMASYKTDAEGKIVSYDLTDRTPTNEDLAALCKLTDVTECKIYGADITTGGAACIANMKKCVKLSIENTDLQDSDMEFLSRMPSVEELTLRRNTYLKTKTLEYVATLPKLRNLVLLYGSFTDTCLKKLSGVKTLRLLDVRGCGEITDAGLAVVKNMPNLIVIKLRCADVTNAGIEYFRGKKLRTFGLEDSQTFNEDAISVISEMGDTLSEVTIMRCINMKDEGIIKLGTLKKMKKLDLRGDYITGKALVCCKNMPDLMMLNVCETLVDDEGLSYLSDLKKLKSINLWMSRVTDKGMMSLGKITSLETLNLSNTSVTDAGLAQLKSLTNLQDLNLSETAITNESVAVLSEFKNLKNLNVKFTQLTNKGLRKLRAALPECVIED